MKTKKQKQVKIFFCPKCKNKEVGFIFAWRNIFGLMPKMKCKKCKFEGMIFPQLVIDKGKLDKLNKKEGQNGRGN